MNTLSELFARDPLSLTDEDIKEIVKAFRDMNSKFNLGDTRAGSTKPPAAKSLAGANADELQELLKGGLKI